MANENLVSLTGCLVDIFPKLDRNTILHSDDLTNARRTNPDLRNVGFWTADSPLYVVDGKNVILYLGRNKDNIEIGRAHV